jgi:hypothetical protein
MEIASFIILNDPKRYNRYLKIEVDEFCILSLTLFFVHSRILLSSAIIVDFLPFVFNSSDIFYKLMKIIQFAIYWIEGLLI